MALTPSDQRWTSFDEDDSDEGAGDPLQHPQSPDFERLTLFVLLFRFFKIVLMLYSKD